MSKQTAARANKRYMVRSVTKQGRVSRAPLTDADWQLRAATTEQQAEEIVARLERLNPGCVFVITEL